MAKQLTSVEAIRRMKEPPGPCAPTEIHEAPCREAANPNAGAAQCASWGMRPKVAKNPSAGGESLRSATMYLNGGKLVVTAFALLLGALVLLLSVGSRPARAAAAPPVSLCINVAVNSSGATQEYCVPVADGNPLPVTVKSGGGGSVVDGSTFTPGTSTDVPAGCAYFASITQLSSGTQGVVACSPNREQYFDTLTTSTMYQAMTSGVATFGSAFPTTGLAGALKAQSSEPVAATTGTGVAAWGDLVGKTVTSPYANRENMLRCAVTDAANTATTCTGMGAQGASVKIYVTDLCITRSDAGTTAISATLNDSATTIIDLPNNGGGGGFCKTYNVPLVVAANTAFQITMSAATTNVHISATGFAGY